MRLMINFISIVSIPLMFLNMLGGTIAGVWLLILGQWQLVLLTIAVSIFAPNILSFIMLILMLFAIPAVDQLESGKNKLISYVLIFVALLLKVALMSLWGTLVFKYLTDSATPKNTFPLHLMSYVVSTGPFAYMIAKNPTDAEGVLLCFWYQLTYVLMLFIAFFVDADFLQVFLMLLSLMFIPVIFSLVIAVNEKNKLA